MAAGRPCRQDASSPPSVPSHAPSPIGRDAVFLFRLALDPVQEGAEVVKAAIGETATGDGVAAELAERRRLQVLPHLFVEISPVSGHKKTPCKNLSDFCMELADSSERCKRFPILSGFVLFFPVWATHRWDALRRGLAILSHPEINDTYEINSYRQSYTKRHFMMLS